LERGDDVVDPGAQERDRSDRDEAHPNVHAEAPEHEPNETDHEEVRQRHHQQVRHVRAHSKDRKEKPVHEDRHGQPMFIVWLEEATSAMPTEQAPIDEQVPFVGVKPAIPADHQEEDERGPERARSQPTGDALLVTTRPSPR
jgi:hypothetical protein